MASQALTNALEATGFLSGGQPAAGVLLGKEAEGESRGRSLRPDAVWISKSRLTVYFKDAPSPPSVDDVAQWRRDAWNHGFAPLLWVVSPERIDLYNGFARPQRVGDAEATRLGTFEHIDSELERLDAIAGRLAMETGAFWERPLADAVDRRDRVDRQLLSDLAALERDLLDDGLPRADAQALIGRSVFAQFLLDRGILNIHESLAAILRKPDAARSLFDWLSETFNGDMFPQCTATSRDAHLRRVADFLEAVDPETGQTTLFPYRFEVIPVEVISSIYEQFAQAASAVNGSSPNAVEIDVFYTPVPLVSLVLDEITEGLTGDETVLDLTCGSAVFLVEALRRLVACRKKGNVVTGELVRTVLYDQIYGVDISPAAVRVAAFSLYLAALELDPGLATLKLDPHLTEASVSPFEPLIGRNLIVGDAWDEQEALLVDGELRKFDLIVGNPPWSDPGKNARAERKKRKGEGSVPLARGDSINFAYRALEFASPHTRIGLVLSANQFFAKGIGRGPTPVQQLVEMESLLPVTLVNLSNLRQWLFPNSALPALVLFARHREAPSDTITTVQVPWYRSAEKTATIEVSPSDVLAIPRGACRRNKYILKAAFLGKRRDLALLERLGTEHLELKEELQRLDTRMRAGVGGAGRGTRNAKELQGRPFLDNDAWKAEREGETTPFSLPSRLPKFQAERATWPRKAANFHAPLVLVKENLSMSPRPVVLMADRNTVYSDAFHGIVFSRTHMQAAAILTATLQSALAAWFLLMTSANFGAWMQRIKIRDLDPFPTPDLITSPATEEGRRVVTKLRRLRRRKAIGELDRVALDEAVFDLYGLREQERIVVRDGLGRAQWQWHDEQVRSVEAISTDELNDYASVFLGVMEDWLQSAQPRRMRAQVFDLPLDAPLRVVRFVLEKRNTASASMEVVTPNGNLREVLERLGGRLRVRLGSELYGQRELRVHGPAEVVIIKPNARRHWMRVCALEDADAVIVESWTGRNR